MLLFNFDDWKETEISKTRKQLTSTTYACVTVRYSVKVSIGKVKYYTRCIGRLIVWTGYEHFSARPTETVTSVLAFRWTIERMGKQKIITHQRFSFVDAFFSYLLSCVIRAHYLFSMTYFMKRIRNAAVRWSIGSCSSERWWTRAVESRFKMQNNIRRNTTTHQSNRRKLFDYIKYCLHMLDSIDFISTKLSIDLVFHYLLQMISHVFSFMIYWPLWYLCTYTRTKNDSHGEYGTQKT